MMREPRRLSLRSLRRQTVLLRLWSSRPKVVATLAAADPGGAVEAPPQMARAKERPRALAARGQRRRPLRMVLPGWRAVPPSDQGGRRTTSLALVPAAPRPWVTGLGPPRRRGAQRRPQATATGQGLPVPRRRGRHGTRGGLRLQSIGTGTCHRRTTLRGRHRRTAIGEGRRPGATTCGRLCATRHTDWSPTPRGVSA